MKKRTFCLLLAMIMVLSIVLAGCSSKTAETPAADETPAATEPAETTDTPAAPEETAEPALEQKTIQLMITGSGKQTVEIIVDGVTVETRTVDFTA